MLEVRISGVALTDPVAQMLIRELNSELMDLYPEDGANHFRLDPEDVQPGRGVFLTVVDALTGSPLGCGALRILEPGIAEIKRMYVRPAARGREVGRRLLSALEEHGAALGARRLVLETGARQAEALCLYHQAGFAETDRFGEYINSPLSVCMAKTLGDSGPH